MTRYLKAGWDNHRSTPLEDVRAARKSLAAEIDYEPAPGSGDAWIYEQVELHYQKTGVWPTHVILPGGIGVPIPPRSSR